MGIDLYYSWSSGPCQQVMLVAAALKLDLNLKYVNTRTGDNKTPEFLKLNPQHTIPTLVDDDFSIWESRAISRYLINKYGGDDNPLYPKDAKIRAVIDQRLDFDIGTLYARFSQYLFPQILGQPADEALFKKLQEALELLSTFLKGQKFAASDELTLADICLATNIATMETLGVDLKSYPNILKWFDLVKSTAPKAQEIYDKGREEVTKLIAQMKANKNSS